VTYFLPPLLEHIKNTYCMGKRPFLYLYRVLYLANGYSYCDEALRVD